MTTTKQHAGGAELPELGDRGRWDGDVVATDEGVVRWGTHRIPYRVQQFADGTTTVQGSAPADAPVCADEIVADLLDGSPFGRALGVRLAELWDVDLSEVTR